jgi:hypothetical protein
MVKDWLTKRFPNRFKVRRQRADLLPRFEYAPLAATL